MRRGGPLIRHSTLQECLYKEGGAKPRAGENIILRTMCQHSNMEMVLQRRVEQKRTGP